MMDNLEIERLRDAWPPKSATPIQDVIQLLYEAVLALSERVAELEAKVM